MDSAKKGSLFGAILLIAGCCIGAGMLGTPVLSAAAGFVPSLVAFTFAWLYMVVTGLYLLEVNLWFKKDVSLISMTGETLGRVAQAACWILFLYLFYSLMVAYVAGSGALTSGLMDDFGVLLPKWVGSAVFTLLFALLLYFGTGVVDRFNRLLMFGLVASYLALILMGVRYVKPELLSHVNWKASLIAVPTMIISFGYHNLIPSMTAYLGHDKKRLIQAILIGSAIPLIVYLTWQYVILGIVPADELVEAMDGGELATRALKKAVNSTWVTLLAEYFAFFALVSSFLAVALSFVDFLSDGLGISKSPKGLISLLFLTLAPPLLFAMVYPTIFLNALSYGAIGALLLFGVLPPLMVWKKRIKGEEIVPGGKGMIVFILIVSMFVIFYQLGV